MVYEQQGSLDVLKYRETVSGFSKNFFYEMVTRLSLKSDLLNRVALIFILKGKIF
jgi:hypothetical protein